MDRLKEISERKTEIKNVLASVDSEEELRSLNAEVDALNEEANQIKAEESRKKVAKELEIKNIATDITENIKKEERKMENVNILESAEYRSAYLKNLMGKELNEVEERAMTTASSKAVPTSTANKIIAALRNVCPVLEDINLYYGSGYLKVFVKDAFGTASEAEEGADLTSQDIELKEVELTPKRITEFMRISGSLNDMSIDDFEEKMIEDITTGLAKKIENKIFTVMNTVTANISGEITETNVFELYGSLKSSYAAGAKFYMNRATKAKVMAVSNKSKNDLYLNGGILGTAIRETDELSDGVIIYGNGKFIAGELGKEISVETDRTLHNDSYEFLGATMFDTKMAIAEAFKKIAPTE